MTKPYPDNGEHVIARVTKWYLTGKTPCVTLEDHEGRKYIHWLIDDNRWRTIWQDKIGDENLYLKLRCGMKEGARGLTSFPVDLVIGVPDWKPKSAHNPFQVSNDVPRSPYDDVSKLLDETTKSIEYHGPSLKRPRSPMGKVTFDPELTKKLWKAADTLGVGLAVTATLCITEGRTPEALITSRGK